LGPLVQSVDKTNPWLRVWGSC